jgi:hypothetical protein
MQQNLTPQHSPTLRTYASAERAAEAAAARSDVPFVVCPVECPAAGGKQVTRFAAVFLPSEKQAVLAVALASLGFPVIRN